MISKCFPFSSLWSITWCNTACWIMVISALIFIYQYYLSVIALFIQFEASVRFPTISTSGTTTVPELPHPRQHPLLNGKSLTLWRIATCVSFLLHTYLAFFAGLITYTCISQVREWAMHNEDGVRPVIMLVFFFSLVTFSSSSDAPRSSPSQFLFQKFRSIE